MYESLLNVAYKNSLWNYGTCSPTLIVWIVLTYKTLDTKEGVGWLFIISLLMCAALIFAMFSALFYYKYIELAVIDQDEVKS